MMNTHADTFLLALFKDYYQAKSLEAFYEALTPKQVKLMQALGFGDVMRKLDKMQWNALNHGN